MLNVYKYLGMNDTMSDNDKQPVFAVPVSPLDKMVKHVTPKDEPPEKETNPL